MSIVSEHPRAFAADGIPGDGLQRGFTITVVSDAHSTVYRDADKIIRTTNFGLAEHGASLRTSRLRNGATQSSDPRFEQRTTLPRCADDTLRVGRRALN